MIGTDTRYCVGAGPTSGGGGVPEAVDGVLVGPVSVGIPGTGGAGLEELTGGWVDGGGPVIDDPGAGTFSVVGGEPNGACMGGDTPGVVLGGASCATAGVTAPIVKSPAMVRTRLSFISASIRKTPGRSGDVSSLLSEDFLHVADCLDDDQANDVHDRAHGTSVHSAWPAAFCALSGDDAW